MKNFGLDKKYGNFEDRLIKILNQFLHTEDIEPINLKSSCDSQHLNNTLLIRTTPTDKLTLETIKTVVTEKLSVNCINSVYDVLPNGCNCLLLKGLKDFPILFHDQIWSTENTRFIVILDGVYGNESTLILKHLSGYVNNTSRLNFIDAIRQLLISADAGKLKNADPYWQSAYLEQLSSDHTDYYDQLKGCQAIANKLLFIAIDYILPHEPDGSRDELDGKGWLLNRIRAATKENAPYLGVQLRQLVNSS